MIESYILVTFLCVIGGVLVGYRLGYKSAQEHFLDNDEKFFDDLCDVCELNKDSNKNGENNEETSDSR